MNKILTFAILILGLVSCKQQAEKTADKIVLKEISFLEVPTNTINKSALKYNTQNSRWTLEGELFSGYAISHFPDSSLMQKIGILNGQKQNEALDWFPDGHLKYSANYHLGKLHGHKQIWSSDSTHLLIADLNYHLAITHGTQKKWYKTGEIFKILQLNMGKEEGIQQAFRLDGSLYANYEARAGRIFGLKRAALCFELEEEDILYEK